MTWPICRLTSRSDFVAEQEDDHAQQHAEDAEHHQPQAGSVDALDDPAVGQSDRAVGLLAEPVGRRNEIQAVVGDQRHVGQRQHEAAAELDPGPAAIRHVLGEGIDARMRIDRVAVAHPQREDGGVEVPLQLLQLGVGQLHAELARDDIEGGHARHDDQQPPGGQGDPFEQPAQTFRQLQQVRSSCPLPAAASSCRRWPTTPCRQFPSKHAAQSARPARR